MSSENLFERGEGDPDTGTELGADERWRRTAIAAFYRAEARGFAPGAELDDWLAAERELDNPLAAVSDEARVIDTSVAGAMVSSGDETPAKAARKRPAARRGRHGRSAGTQARSATGEAW